MHIAMHASGIPFNGETIPSGKSLGGSESAAYYMARELAKLGHRVVLFTADRRPGNWDGVIYEWHGEMSEQYPLGDRFHFVLRAPHDVVIAQRHPLAFARTLNSKLNVWWLHDLALHRNAWPVHSQLWNVDRILTVSEFHKKQVETVYGIAPETVVATTNGVDYAAFDGIGAGRREARSLVFAARPERGLEELVGEGGIMERLTDCRLYVCGYDNTVPEMRGYYEYLWRRCDQLPNVKRMGSLGKRELYELLGRSMLYVYPTAFEDTSCILALESFAAGTPFIGCQNAALPETCAGGGARLIPLRVADGQRVVDRAGFARQVRKLLDNAARWQDLHMAALGKRQSWEAAARQWDELFSEVLTEKSTGNAQRLARHFELMSDIHALEEFCGWDADRAELLVPGFKRNYRFALENDFAGHYARYYEYEKNRGVNYGPEDLTGNPRFEQTAQIVGRLQPKHVMDYGCAHGHYVMNLLKRFPEIRFTGVDIERSNIHKAVDWAVAEAPEGNLPKWIIGDAHNTDELTKDRFDLIIAAEVLEHVQQPHLLVAKLAKYLAPGGTILITVPYGPWEAIGYAQHPGWRAHLHHFERADLFEMFGGQPDYKLMAVPHSDDLGHFILTFRPHDAPIGTIDYQRKIKQQAPRETLSVCMIAKDCEHTLGRALESIRDIATEIIVAVDRTTTDETRRVAESFGAVVAEIESPVVTGFDVARNASIAVAEGDWILWIDDDETVENADRLVKYLRANGIDGYALRQHHVAAEPATVLKTDLPVRMFRNRRGVKFFGVVHEHPEKEINEGVGRVWLIPDVDIMHTGYLTENVRRRRFERNFPLMVRDRQTYPDRKLGKFLMVRDIAHLIRYNMERTGGRQIPQNRQHADVALALWRELLADGETRLVTEALPFLAQSVLTLGGGIEYAVNLAAAPNGSNGGPKLAAEPVRALLPTTADIMALTEHLTRESVKIFDERYF